MKIEVGTLSGDVALITGASRGIGRAVAERLARDGAAVVVNYVKNQVAAQEVVDTIEAAGGMAFAIQADMENLDDIRQMMRATVDRFGKLDILVANAGYSDFKSFSDTTEADFDQTFAVNAKGTFFCLQEALRHMADGGRIVCVSTIGTVLNLAGGACYFGSKAAVEQYCRVLAKEVADRGIRVNAISPGFVETEMLHETMDDDSAPLVDMTPMGRLGQPDDIARAVAFLVGPDAGWVTRQNLSVDGGIISR
jgi:3-oxoacyl-[acyl-carrier protein] reductase